MFLWEDIKEQKRNFEKHFFFVVVLFCVFSCFCWLSLTPPGTMSAHMTEQEREELACVYAALILGDEGLPINVCSFSFIPPRSTSVF